ncbi:MAG: hypothetical protein NVS2B17_21390 [Candidatus Velthaea sp.]
MFAGTGGLLAIGFSAGMPLWQWAHGHPATPAFFFFGMWGVAALCGAAASVHTYLISGDPPDKPPKGGVPIREFSIIEGGRGMNEGSDERSQRAA